MNKKSRSRRGFLFNTTKLAAAYALTGPLRQSIAKAHAIAPSISTGTIQDVKHIVILMQENRAFDHYLGCLPGVRGFGDPRPVILPSGYPVWYQPGAGSYVLPFRPDPGAVSEQTNGNIYYNGLDHGWPSTHDAWNQGVYDSWVNAKGESTMVHFNQQDIPYYYALAQAFTVCDNYHCSMLGPTDPNRLYLFTGSCGNVQGSTPHIDNSTSGYNWATFPERLNKAGISWKVYQDKGQGLTSASGVGEYETGTGRDLWWTGNYGDNALLNFKQYQGVLSGVIEHLTPAFNGTQLDPTGRGVPYDRRLFQQLTEDVKSGSLPEVSWVVAPFAYCEHPSWAASGGEWYVSHVLDALTTNPEVFAQTVFIVTYDENDGFFDHVPPPVPPTPGTGVSNVDVSREFYNNGNTADGTGQGDTPIGLGPRVPMIAISPWSKGGKVNSQVFDHTSILRFIEARFGAQAREDNITPWRRAVCGDLTSAFDFSAGAPRRFSMPVAAGMDPNGHAVDATPPREQSIPSQLVGRRPACRLPYAFDIAAHVARNAASLSFTMTNFGQEALCLDLRFGATGATPRRYTVDSSSSIQDSILISNGRYDIAVHGPNGFLRKYRGDTNSGAGGNFQCEANIQQVGGAVVINLDNSQNSQMATFQLTDNIYQKNTYTEKAVGASGKQQVTWNTDTGWYDVSIRLKTDANFHRRFAGCVQPTSQEPCTDPAIGNADLFLPKLRIQGESVTDLRFDYVAPPWLHSPKNWIAIYQPGDTPGSNTNFLAWVYAPHDAGSVMLSSGKTGSLTSGTYAAWYLFDDAYKSLLGPIPLRLIS